jgi:hypothetical protein
MRLFPTLPHLPTSDLAHVTKERDVRLGELGRGPSKIDISRAQRPYRQLSSDGWLGDADATASSIQCCQPFAGYELKPVRGEQAPAYLPVSLMLESAGDGWLKSLMSLGKPEQSLLSIKIRRESCKELP